MNAQGAIQNSQLRRHLPEIGSASLLCLLGLMPSPAVCQAPAHTHSISHADTFSHIAQKAKKAMQPATIYVLDIPNTKQAFGVSLNGWAIDRNPGGTQGYFSSQIVGDKIADGQNTVSILLIDPPHGAVPDRFQVRIRSSEGEAFYYDWEPADPKHTLPMTITKHFEAHLPHGPWAWQTAPKITLDAQTKTAINAFIKRLFDALNTKNVDESTALFASRMRDDYAARNLSAAEADADLRSSWVEDFAKPGWRMDPIDYAHLDYTLCAEGRAVQVTRADGSYALRDGIGKPDDPHDSYDLLLCQVKGQWGLIR